MPDIAGTELVVPADLEVAGERLAQQSQAIVDQLEALKTQLAPLAETWTGVAASYYQPLQLEWNTAADGLFGPTGVLGQIAEAMHVTWANYAECEWSNAKGWRQ
ncbi:WXG100 family type VII secretion target [Dactylosporangium sp. NPDC000244]|uniref:WXG100 family type VII secretion target n=1 Tax=Dactylosporangium sp. NPDC000244 TaxID=3154365 RepID=UPI00331C3173